MVRTINPIVRGWVNYFALGHSGRCLGYVRNWIELKVRRHMMRALKRRGFGWNRWSTEWLYATLGLFHGYRVRAPLPTGAGLGLISRGMKRTGERSARKTARYVRCGGGWKRDDGSRTEGQRESAGIPTAA